MFRLTRRHLWGRGGDAVTIFQIVLMALPWLFCLCILVHAVATREGGGRP